MSNLDGNKPGTKNITGDVNVQVAPTPNITVGNTTTLEPGQSATVELDSSSTALNPKFNFGIPKGEQGLQGIQGIPGVPGVDGYTPQKGEDYWTDAEKKEIVDETTEKVLTDATNKFNVNYESKVNEFNENADNKILEFNNNADEKTTSYNQNATNKTTEFNNNVNSIKDDIEDLKSNQIKGTSSGTNITLNDSANMKMASLVVDGKSTQETRSGKNLMKYPYISENNSTSNGITFTVNNDGTIIINGQNDRNGHSTFRLTSTENYSLPAGTYYMIDPQNSSIEFMGYDGSNYTSIGKHNGYSLTLSEQKNIMIYVQIVNGNNTAFNNFKIYPMLSTSSGETSDTYEAFGVSPSPDYPSEIETITGEVEVKVIGKNLLPLPTENQTVNGITYTIDKEKGTIIANGTATSNANLLLLKPYNTNGKNYFVSGCPSGGGNSTYTIYTQSDNDNGNGTIVNTSNGYIGIRVYAGITVNNLVFKPMMVEGITATEFEPYQENKIEFILPKPSCSLPNGVKDEIYIKDGKAYLKKNVGRVDLGTLVWAYKSDYGFSSTITGAKGPANNNTKANAMCDIYTVYTANNCYGLTGSISSGISITMSGTGVIVRETNYTDVETFTNAMSGYYFYYELAEPYEIDLGEVTMPKTYKNVSNIMNSKDTNMNVEYYKDLETVINNLTSAVVALGATE